MNEKLRVLKMLEEGRINADEAERLLHALDRKSIKSRITESLMHLLNFGAWTGEMELESSSVSLLVSMGDLEIKKGEVPRIVYSGWVRKRGERIILRFGDATLELPPGSSLDLEVSMGDVKGEFDGRLNLLVSMGDCNLLLGRASEVYVENSMGDVIFKLPEDAGYEVDVFLSMGEVSSEWELEEKIHRIRGVIGDGKGKIEGSVNMGNLEIKRR
ncbi:hypothetical protein DRQ18_08135 [bacterium]|nr:MAG: hypothetical protein DRQ18_08135 [bacterium]